MSAPAARIEIPIPDGGNGGVIRVEVVEDPEAFNRYGGCVLEVEGWIGDRLKGWTGIYRGVHGDPVEVPLISEDPNSDPVRYLMPYVNGWRAEGTDCMIACLCALHGIRKPGQSYPVRVIVDDLFWFLHDVTHIRNHFEADPVGLVVEAPEAVTASMESDANLDAAMWMVELFGDIGGARALAKLQGLQRKFLERFGIPDNALERFGRVFA